LVKKTNNGPQNTTQKTIDCATLTPVTIGGEPEGLAVHVSFVPLVVLFKSKIL